MIAETLTKSTEAFNLENIVHAGLVFTKPLGSIKIIAMP